ncbi:hypothetical protein RRG08_058902 [Elysia crispata]|uniref:Uncharacterized protein n=1 Tax=Elysia crispata TaxID=231223 RepID=A0AAE0ZCQ7_9GAST|nr:hypothetical protein RRG08_058902 [Elysia crispata]
MSPSINNIATKPEAEECIFVDCTLQEKERVTIGLFYRSPNSTKENNDKINRTILASVSTNSPHLIIMGISISQRLIGQREPAEPENIMRQPNSSKQLRKHT